MQSDPPFLRKRLLPPSASLLPQRSAASVAPPLLRGEASARRDHGLQPQLPPSAFFLPHRSAASIAPVAKGGSDADTAPGEKVLTIGDSPARLDDFRGIPNREGDADGPHN